MGGEAASRLRFKITCWSAGKSRLRVKVPCQQDPVILITKRRLVPLSVHIMEEFKSASEEVVDSLARKSTLDLISAVDSLGSSLS